MVSKELFARENVGRRIGYQWDDFLPTETKHPVRAIAGEFGLDGVDPPLISHVQIVAIARVVKRLAGTVTDLPRSANR
ncbi:hypothetical protein [Roseiconus lacunae]|uniref:Uncharacterized protein n=1 Tax=Roseiconus lacunae TaxID=2605694 RepID=A0ABT7PET6_9BACT|nr:hypothetical protein [Roseiconus lacunae]MDM4015015.1 hypothetical protein [Roseiconus lacunae]